MTRLFLCGFLLLSPILACAGADGETYDAPIVAHKVPREIAAVYDKWIGKLPAQLEYAWGAPSDSYVLDGYRYLRYSIKDCHTVFRAKLQPPVVIEAWREYGTTCPD